MIFQEENLAAEAELARQEEEKKLQAQKLESVSPLYSSLWYRDIAH